MGGGFLQYKVAFASIMGQLVLYVIIWLLGFNLIRCIQIRSQTNHMDNKRESYDPKPKI